MTSLLMEDFSYWEFVWLPLSCTSFIYVRELSFRHVKFSRSTNNDHYSSPPWKKLTSIEQEKLSLVTSSVKNDEKLWRAKRMRRWSNAYIGTWTASRAGCDFKEKFKNSLRMNRNFLIQIYKFKYGSVLCIFNFFFC